MRPSLIGLFWVILYAFLVCRTWLCQEGMEGRRYMMYGLDFLATAEKGATPFQETNRPASVRLYIFCCSSKPPFDKSRRSPRCAAVSFSNIILPSRYPGCRHFKEGVAPERMHEGRCARANRQWRRAMRSWENCERAKCIPVNYKTSAPHKIGDKFAFVMRHSDTMLLRCFEWSIGNIASHIASENIFQGNLINNFKNWHFS